MVVEASGDVALAAENAFALYMGIRYPDRRVERYAEHAIVHAKHADSGPAQLTSMRRVPGRKSETPRRAGAG
jgi:hypothetical protein